MSLLARTFLSIVSLHLCRLRGGESDHCLGHVLIHFVRSQWLLCPSQVSPTASTSLRHAHYLRFAREAHFFRGQTPIMLAAGWKKLSAEELRTRHCRESERPGRDKSVITRLFVKQLPCKKQGRPATSTPARASSRAAPEDYGHAAAMVTKAAKLKVSDRLIRDTF